MRGAAQADWPCRRQPPQEGAAIMVKAGPEPCRFHHGFPDENMKLFDQYRGRTSQYLRKRLFTGEKVMRNNVVTIATTATLIASQLAVPAMPQATTLPYPIPGGPQIQPRSEEHTPELQSLMRISYAVFCLK